MSPRPLTFLASALFLASCIGEPVERNDYGLLPDGASPVSILPQHTTIPATTASLENWGNSPFRLIKNDNAWKKLNEILPPNSTLPQIDFFTEQMIAVWTPREAASTLPWAYAADGTITVVLKHDAYARMDYSKSTEALAEATEFRIYRITIKAGGVSRVMIEQPRDLPPANTRQKNIGSP